MAIPSPTVPIGPTTAQLNARNQAVGAPVTSNGAYTAPGGGSATPQTPVAPTLTASFTQPNLTTKVNAPAVITSQQAEDHVGAMQTAATNASSDLQALQAHNATTGGTTASLTPPASTSSNDTSAPSQSDVSPDQSDPISQLLSTLGGQTAVNDVSSTGIDSEQAQINQDQADIEAMNDPNNPVGIPATLQAMYAMSNGTYPLTAAQQAQINDIPAQYATAMMTAKSFAQNILGGTIARDAMGLQEYSPGIALSNISSAIQAGGQKIAKVNTDMLDAQSKLQTAIEDGDYKAATLYMTQLNDGVKLRTDEISNINTAIDREQTKMNDSIKNTMTAIMDSHTISNDDKIRALAQSTLDEKTTYDAQRIKIEQEKLNAAASGSGLSGSNNLPVVGMTPEGGGDPIQQQAFLAALPGGVNGDIATDVKALADYMMNPNDFQQKNYKGGLGLTHQQIISLVKKYSPSYNEANYAAAAKYLASLKSTTVNSTGGQLQSANRAIEHLTTFYNATLTHWNTPPGGDKYIEKGSQAAAEAQILSTELPKYFRGNGVAESDIKDWQKSINPNSRPEGLNGQMAGTLSLLSEQLSTSYASYENALGHAPPAPGQPGSLLTANAYAALQQMHDTLQKAGVDVSNIDLTQFAGIPNPDPVGVGAPPAANNNPAGI